MKRLVVDVDHTLCCPQTSNTASVADPDEKYRLAKPNLEFIGMLLEYREKGFEIVLFSARNMNTYKGDVDKIKVHTVPILLDWLEKNSVPYDELVVGKPWCGHDGFYIDDRAVRPAEFIGLEYSQILDLIKRDAYHG